MTTSTKAQCKTRGILESRLYQKVLLKDEFDLIDLWIRKRSSMHPIGLHNVCHEPFEVRLGDSISRHDVVEVMLENHLSIIVLELEVTATDDHDALVGPVVYVVGHGALLGDAFDMVRHDPIILEIPTRLRAPPNQVPPLTIHVAIDCIHNDNPPPPNMPYRVDGKYKSPLPSFNSYSQCKSSTLNSRGPPNQVLPLTINVVVN